MNKILFEDENNDVYQKFVDLLKKSGAPNEKTVQNPCNIAFLNVF